MAALGVFVGCSTGRPVHDYGPRNRQQRAPAAGGPPPLIIHEDWTVEEPKSQGPPLGVMEDIPYREKTVKLIPGDSILLFSDGAVEIQNSRDEWLGVKEFTEILKGLDYPKTPLNMEAFEEQLLKYSNDIRLQDDITIIETRYFG